MRLPPRGPAGRTPAAPGPGLRATPTQGGRAGGGGGRGGAAHLEITAADTAVIVHRHDSVGAAGRGLYRADLDARRVLAVHARPGQIDRLSGQLTRSHDGVPLDPRGDIVVRPASLAAVAAAGALGLIDDHRPAVRAVAGGFP